MAGHLAVINAGGWGTALAVLLGNAGHPVRLWCRRAELALEIEATGENRTYLPGVTVPPPVLPSASLEEVLIGADALMNVIALATGAADGLGYGDNARAALITRALAEIGRLVQAAGGDARSVAGLAGLGDVVVTCTSRHSRNRWAGEQIGRDRSVQD